jgi:hypothetical protein
MDQPSHYEFLGASSMALASIAEERHRQVVGYDFGQARDDGYERGELLRAADTYLAAGAMERITEAAVSRLASRWPWHQSSLKLGDRRRNLVKAAALIVAEIERLDRASAAIETETGR